MADDQMEPSERLSDAIRQAERQLDEKIEALRMSALGDSAATIAPDLPLEGSGAPADLQPTGAIPAGVPETMHVPELEPELPAPAPEYEPIFEPVDDASSLAPLTAPATPEPNDALLRAVPSDGEPLPAGGFVADADQPGTVDVDDLDLDPEWEPAPMAERPRWEDEPGVGELEPSASEPAWEPAPVEEAPYEFEREAVDQSSRSGWTPAPAYEPQPQLPSEEEVQFWAQTRTALRMLQQSADTIPQQVTSSVTSQVEGIVRDELAAPNATLRQIQAQAPTLAERVERAVSEDLPVQVDRVERSIRENLRDELARAEQSLAEDIERSNRATGDGVVRAERAVAEQLDRIDQSVKSQFERIESMMRSDLTRVEEGLRDQIETPTTILRQVQEELPGEFQRVERTVREQDPTAALDRISRSVTDLREHQREMAATVASSIRDDMAGTRRGVKDLVELDLGGILGDLLNASRLTLDKLGNFASDLDRDRLQRVEDLEMLIDSMSTGWRGLYGAVTKLFDRVDAFDTRLAGVERQLEAISELEQTVDVALGNVRRQMETHLGAMQTHLQELQPAPVVVTVNHPEAQIAHSTRAGFTTGKDVGA